MAQWWLSVFFYINGAWVPGDALDGWASRAYESQAICEQRKVFAERECKDHPLPYESYWMCNEGAPAEHPPFAEPELEC